MQVNGIDLAYERQGDPADPPIILVAGLGAQLLSWRVGFCRQLVDRGYQVVRFDNRDVGLSTRFTEGGYTIADMAADAAGLIEALGFDSAHVVGQSLGGMIAQELAIRYPDRVRSLGLLFSTPNLSHFISAGVEVLAGDGEPVHDREVAIRDLLMKETYFAGPKYPVDVEQTRELAGLSWDRAPDPEGAGRQMAAIIGSRDLVPHLGAVRAPTVVIHGADDPLISPSAARSLAGSIPDAWLHVVPGMGHQLPAALWPEVAGWIAANAGR